MNIPDIEKLLGLNSEQICKILDTRIEVLERMNLITVWRYFLVLNSLIYWGQLLKEFTKRTDWQDTKRMKLLDDAFRVYNKAIADFTGKD